MQGYMFFKHLFHQKITKTLFANNSKYDIVL